jgi:hypothetical protein
MIHRAFGGGVLRKGISLMSTLPCVASSMRSFKYVQGSLTTHRNETIILQRSMRDIYSDFSWLSTA